jgi:hypothetical protein
MYPQWSMGFLGVDEIRRLIQALGLETSCDVNPVADLVKILLTKQNHLAQLAVKFEQT